MLTQASFKAHPSVTIRSYPVERGLVEANRPKDKHGAAPGRISALKHARLAEFSGARIVFELTAKNGGAGPGTGPAP
jgi:hypothetical protein